MKVIRDISLSGYFFKLCELSVALILLIMSTFFLPYCLTTIGYIL